MIVTHGAGQQLHSQSLPGDLAVVEGQRNGKLGHSCVNDEGQALWLPGQRSCAFRFKGKQLNP